MNKGMFVPIALAIVLLLCGTLLGPHVFWKKSAGDWKIELNNGEEVEWGAPFTIREDSCADYDFKENWKEARDEEKYLLVPKDIKEKIDYFGVKGKYVIRYMNGERRVFPVCTKLDIQTAYASYLKRRFDKEMKK